MPAATLLSLGRLLLPLVLLLLSFTNNLVLSTHFNCTWQPGKAAPETYGYVQYCEAGVIAGVANNTTTTAEYRCSPGGGGQRDAKVADWGVLGSKLLEWYTPCGNPGGYGLNEKHLCLSSHWACASRASAFIWRAEMIASGQTSSPATNCLPLSWSTCTVIRPRSSDWRRRREGRQRTDGLTWGLTGPS